MAVAGPSKGELQTIPQKILPLQKIIPLPICGAVGQTQAIPAGIACEDRYCNPRGYIAHAQWEEEHEARKDDYTPPSPFADIVHTDCGSAVADIKRHDLGPVRRKPPELKNAHQQYLSQPMPILATLPPPEVLPATIGFTVWSRQFDMAERTDL